MPRNISKDSLSAPTTQNQLDPNCRDLGAAYINEKGSETLLRPHAVLPIRLVLDVSFNALSGLTAGLNGRPHGSRPASWYGSHAGALQFQCSLAQ